MSSPVLARPADSRRKRRLVESDEEDEEQANWSGGSDSEANGGGDDVEWREAEAVKWFNDAEAKAIVEVTACSVEQADIILSLRPFSDPADLRKKMGKRKGITARIFDDYVDILEGYAKVDTLLTRCEAVGKELLETVGVWGDTSGSVIGSAAGSRAGSVGPEARQVGPPAQAKEALQDQPANMQNLSLKDYQLYGLSWLYLLYRKGLSCILADEMGLGKTIQVIALYALMKEKGIRGRHLVVVPSSTLENWLREFRRFAPSINVQSYYGSQAERQLRRAELRSDDADWDVLITTYNLAQGAEADRKFFSKKVEFRTCVFDEGHVLKNYQSQRYQHLMQIKVPWRLMLTGTPLQNNLQELVSLLNFLLPKYFSEAQESLRAIFKVKADASTSFLSRERVSRAKTMMTPFVLRRRKDQVLRDLPKKTERVEYCSLSHTQTEIYRDALKRSRKELVEVPDEDEPAKKKTRSSKAPQAKQPADTSSNVLMDLRKAALHPMLFRKRYTDAKLKVMAKDCLKEPEFAESRYDYVVEDMSVMSDAELQVFCEKYKSVHKHKLSDKSWLDSGKVDTLLKLIAEYRSQGRRILVFSQFVQVLDILQHVLDKEGLRYLVLTGSTAVDVRQSLVDEFSEENDIPVFLLSTKAGGMGINLTAASVVVLFDQDFNPHNDRQAADRAYRIGQKRDVDIIKFISRGTIEEDIYRLGQTKLALDVAVAGGEEGTQEGDEGKIEKLMKATLIGALRKKLAADGDDGVIAGTTQLVDSEAEEAFVKEEEKVLNGI
ncbi:hypothetical protein CALCODRAFT_435549 [Calocera cornea HHB12733]|uniref:DNA helicase n=1 Tax=Calocera cornea HHB12733 TaxID=1353952 RepID=A0A165FCY7_9BASI|nr:hypothetical protein CALCODRAFT_435549 [Calocera cornea HHB12733]